MPSKPTSEYNTEKQKNARLETVAQTLTLKGLKVLGKKQDNGVLVSFLTQCPHPAHGDDGKDENPSLQVSLSPDGKLLVKCFVCPPERQDEIFKLFKALISQQDNGTNNNGHYGCSVADLVSDCYELAETFSRLGIKDANFGGYPTVAFPVTYADGSMGYHYRVKVEGKDKWRHQAGGKASEAIFGLGAINPNADHLIVFESPMDCATLIALGFNAIAVLGKGNAKALKHFRKQLPTVKTYVWVEPDASDFAKEVTQALKRTVFAIKPDPDTPKDAYRILKAHNWDVNAARETIQALINAATPTPYEPVFYVSNTSEIWEIAENENFSWLVEGLIPYPAIVGLFGEAGIGKSTFLINLAVSVALGRLFAGKLPTKRGIVLYINSENPIPVLRDKLTALCDEDERDRLNSHLFFLNSQSINPDDDERFSLFVDELDARLSGQQPDLIICDTLNDFLPVDDYNDEAQAKKQMARLRQLRDSFNCAVIAVGHPPKSETASQRRWRGSQARFDAVDIAIDCRKGSSDSQIKLIVAKDRLGMLEKEFVFERCDDYEFNLLSDYDRLPEKAKQILDLLQQSYPQALKRKEIENRLSMPTETLRDNLNRLQRLGLIIRVARGVYQATPKEKAEKASKGVHLMTPNPPNLEKADRANRLMTPNPPFPPNCDQDPKPTPKPTNPERCPECGRLRFWISREWFCLDCDLDPDGSDPSSPPAPTNPPTPSNPPAPTNPPTQCAPNELFNLEALPADPMTRQQGDLIILNWQGKEETVSPDDLKNWQPIDQIPTLSLPADLSLSLPTIITLDLEATDLDPSIGKVLAVGIGLWQDGQIKHEVISDQDEATLLRRTFDLLRKLAYQNPDAILTGYNLLDFDLPFLIERAKALKVECPFTVETHPDGKPIRRKVAATEGTLKSEPIEFPVIKTDLKLTIVDTLHLVCRWDYIVRELRKYDLKSVAEHFGLNEPNRPKLSPQQIVEAFHSDKETFKRYLIADLNECLRLFVKLFPPYFAIAQITKLPVSDICVRSTAWVWERILERHYGQSPEADEKRKYVGGLVVARRGLFYPCCKLDIASLYPTIMLAYRINSRKDPDQHALKWLRTLTAERLKWKAKAKSGDQFADAIQSAMKVLINSLYGFFGTGGYGFNDMDAAERVTLTGRKILTAMIAAIERVGGIIVEADTDGIIVQASDPDAILQAAQTAIPEPFKVELEWQDCIVFVSDEKNYLVLRSNGEILTVKGSKWRGRDKEAILTEFVPTYLRIYATQGQETADIYAKKVRNEIASGQGWHWVVRSHRVGKGDKFLLDAGFKVGDCVTYAFKDKKARQISTNPEEGYDVGFYQQVLKSVLAEIHETIRALPKGDALW